MDTAARLTEVRGTSFHEAGHAVAGLALGWDLRWVKIDPRQGAASPGHTALYVGPSSPPDDFEEGAVINLMGGLAERKHDALWTPQESFRDEDLDWIRNELRTNGHSPEQATRFITRCDRIASSFLEDCQIWRGVTAVAFRLMEPFSVSANAPWKVPGRDISNTLERCVKKEHRDRCAGRIREQLPDLRLLRHPGAES